MNLIIPTKDYYTFFNTSFIKTDKGLYRIAEDEIVRVVPGNEVYGYQSKHLRVMGYSEGEKVLNKLKSFINSL